MFINRKMALCIQKYQKFPVVAILGPRQSGKTTFAKKYFPNHVFVSFEDYDILDEALKDPKEFFEKYDNQHGFIIDEFQYGPKILSTIKYLSDEHNRPGYFVLTGSSNFLMNQHITQSLAGRVGILTMLPLSIAELQDAQLLPSLQDLIFQGSYPKIYQEQFDIDEFYRSYIHSYVERDVRQLVNVVDLRQFQRFMKLCAARIGQLLNLQDLAVSCGITVKTAERWISLLDASYIIYLLPSYHVNFNKRVTSHPKLYFYDTGIACSLLGFQNVDMLSQSSMYGHVFENFIVADLAKQYYHNGKGVPLYFWRDYNGDIEVDCLINQGNSLIPIEIKSSMTMRNEYFDGLVKFQEISDNLVRKNYVVYAGDTTEERNPGQMVSWIDFGTFTDTIKK